MKRIIYIILFFLLLSCKTTQGTKNDKDDPTKYVIDKNNVKKDELREVVKALFGLIEKEIADGNFTEWYNYLSKGYKSFLNDKETLYKISKESEYLFNRNIILQGPRDYFKYVIIAAREGKLLEFYDYQYIDENNIKVTCLFDKKEKYVYKFKFEENSWKLDY
jgi:hypothetical protein